MCSVASRAKWPKSTLSGVATNADGNAVCAAFDALPVAHQHRHQISGHLRGSRKADGVLARPGPRSIGHDWSVRNRGISLINREGDIKGRLQRGFIKGGKRTASVRCLKLRGCVVPILAMNEVEATKLVVEHSREIYVQYGFAGRNWSC